MLKKHKELIKMKPLLTVKDFNCLSELLKPIVKSLNISENERLEVCVHGKNIVLRKETKKAAVENSEFESLYENFKLKLAAEKISEWLNENGFTEASRAIDCELNL
jgi:outer membrane protein assembly factor BamA